MRSTSSGYLSVLGILLGGLPLPLCGLIPMWARQHRPALCSQHTEIDSGVASLHLPGRCMLGYRLPLLYIEIIGVYCDLSGGLPGSLVPSLAYSIVLDGWRGDCKVERPAGHCSSCPWQQLPLPAPIPGFDGGAVYIGVCKHFSFSCS